MAKPTLTVIQGDWVANKKWLNFPAAVQAKSPFDQNGFCLFRIAREDAVKQARVHKREPVFNLWSGILGKPPPVPLVSTFVESPFEGLTRLEHAHACFKGIKRPCAEDSEGQRMIAYVLKPTQFYEYRPHPVCVANKVVVPDDLVFVAFAKLDEPSRPEGHRIKGVLTHWQFVEADQRAGYMLPLEYKTRFDEQLW